ncbi:MAG TPA: metallophosphoesterase, partial [Bacillota bacterium]|nr:metallophosphoesterase [Bacillota bacterium]
RDSEEKKRKDLSELLKGLDTGRPLIMLDHQPSNLGEPQKLGVDLQLSGHTHRGQLWPASLITRRIFENDWGYLLKGRLQVIVSSGFGTWGPPVRIGNHPEIVDIRLKFGTR